MAGAAASAVACLHGWARSGPEIDGVLAMLRRGAVAGGDDIKSTLVHAGAVPALIEVVKCGRADLSAAAMLALTALTASHAIANVCALPMPMAPCQQVGYECWTDRVSRRMRWRRDWWAR